MAAAASPLGDCGSRSACLIWLESTNSEVLFDVDRTVVGCDRSSDLMPQLRMSVDHCLQIRQGHDRS